jgi:catechol 2,3-dioxygenase-like lactoylglutathione lyase family enzyme
VIVDHLTLPVANFKASRRFYLSVLAPLGFGVVDETENEATFGAEDAYDVFSIAGSETSSGGVHVAFASTSREAVDAFHAAALHAGGRDNGAPGLRPEYRADYYAAFALDPDGNNVEAVHFG